MFTTTTSDNALSILLDVETLDASNANEFKDQIKQLQLTGEQQVAVQLHKVSFIDSSGIGALLSLFKQVNRNMILFNPCPEVMSVLELLRLHRVFQIEFQELN